jgi:glycosyltransferase involved in cell wall biosynthesis
LAIRSLKYPILVTPSPPLPLRVAIVHEWLATYAGSEQVLAAMLEMLPQADVFCLVDFLPDEDRAFLAGHRVTPSFLQRLPFARRHFRKYLPLMPRAVASHDLAGYDLVISSAHAFANGARVPRGVLHVSYCYTPMRYAWALQETYLSASGLSGTPLAPLARLQAARLRRWDRAAADRVGAFAACSAHVATRIAQSYHRHAAVIYPPVQVERFCAPRAPREDFFITVSRLVPYKKVDVMVDAFRRLPGRRLVVIGDGPQRSQLARDCPPNVQLLGYREDAEVADWLGRARAFVFAAEEDFGIAPVEAQAAGIPVIAYGVGGACETVRGPDHPAPTGIFFAAQTAEAIAAAICDFDENAKLFSAAACRESAARFHPDRFRNAFGAFLARAQAGEVPH